MPALPPLPPARRRHARRAGGAVGALLALAAVTTAAAPGVIHLSRGDTLSALAVRYGTTVAALQAANGLGTSSRIYAGATLVLPGTTPTGTTTATATAPAGTPAIPAAVTAAAARDRATLATRTVLSRTAVRALIASTARTYGVDPSLALAVAYQESGFQQRVVSDVDAIGAMQVLPCTGRVLSSQVGRSFNLLDTTDNVTAGVLLLRQLLHATGTEPAALAGYYQGFASLAAKGVLPQTTAYIASITALQPRFANG